MKSKESTEQLHTNGNANQIDNKNYGSIEEQMERGDERNTQLVETFEVKETPFTIVKMDKDWHVLMGKFRLNEKPMHSKEECLEYVNEISWDQIMKVIGIMLEEYTEIKELHKRVIQLEIELAVNKPE